MANEVKTIFTGDPQPLFRTLNEVEKKLLGSGGSLNNFGTSVTFGKTLSDNFDLAGKAADKFKTKADDAFKPTISRWADEGNKALTTVNALNASVDRLDASSKNLGNPGANALKRIGENYNETGKPSAKNSPITEKLTADLDSLDKKTNDVRKSLQGIQATRLDAGNVSHLTKEVVRASERSRQLSGDIVNIRRELANPNRKSSIGFLTDELKAAEREADSLNRKLDRVNAKDAAASSTTGRAGRGGRRGARRGGVSEGLLTGLELVDDFAPEGLNRPFNAAVKGLVGVNALSATTLVTFGAIAAVGYGIVKVTQNIREEAERRLKAEDNISAAINRQILGQREALKDLQKARDEAAFGRSFSRDLQTNSVDELKARRDTLEKLQNLIPATLPVLEDGKVVSKTNESFQKVSQQILALDAQIEQIPLNKQKAANDAFGQRFENFKKSQEDAAEAQKRQIELQKKHTEEIEKGKEKVRELGKQYNSVFDNLFQKSGSNNPFVSVFSEADKAIKDLRESLKGLSPELRAVAEQMQQKLNADSLFNARLENDFARFDLKDDADSFRSFKQPKIEDPNKFFDDFIEAGLKQIGAKNGGSGTRFNLTGASNSTFGFSQSNANPYTRYNSNIFTDGNGKKFTSGFTQTDLRDEFTTVFERTGGFSESSNGKGFGNSLGGVFRREKTFADLTNKEKDEFINKDNLSFQNKLSRQIDLAQNRSTLSDEQKRTVDRKLISLTQGVDPSKLTDNQRDVAAGAREREAERLDQNEAKAREQRQQQIELQTRIAVSNETLIGLAQKGGSESVVKFIDQTSGGVELPAAPTAKDVQKGYDDAYQGGTFYEESKK